MSESTAQPTPQLTAVLYNNSGCFPTIIGVGLVVTLFSLLVEAEAPWFLVLIGGTLFFALIAFPSWKQHRHFAQESVVVQGTITRLWSKTIDDGEGGQTTYYYLAYTFPYGQETWQQITAQQCLFAKVGDAVTVRYLPKQPECSQVDWALTLQVTLRAIETAA